MQEGERSLTRATNVLKSQTLVAESYAAELRALSSGRDQWFGSRTDELANAALTDPVSLPAGAGQTLGNSATEKLDVGALLDRWQATTPEGRDLIEIVRGDFRSFTRADRNLDEHAQHTAAEVDSAAARLNDSAVQVRNSLSRLAASEREQFGSAMDAASARLGLTIGIPLLAFGVILLIWAGVAPRLNEYHGWQGRD